VDVNTIAKSIVVTFSEFDVSIVFAKVISHSVGSFSHGVAIAIVDGIAVNISCSIVM
jgi:hypothetical protein